MKKSLAVALLAPFAAVAAIATPASADHLSNNRATFDDAASGTAIVNHSTGQETNNARVSARGLEPTTSYSYWVSLNGGDARLICGFTTNRAGNGGCNATDIALPGFNTAELRSGGTLVDDAVFVRQGRSECRAPQQAGPEAAECPNR